MQAVNTLFYDYMVTLMLYVDTCKVYIERLPVHASYTLIKLFACVMLQQKHIIVLYDSMCTSGLCMYVYVYAMSAIQK